MQLENWQQIFLIIFFIYSFASFVQGIRHVAKNSNAFGLTPQYYPLGVFVWGDAVIFGFFWIITSLVIWFTKDWVLFLLIVSIFWFIRSLGETMYWFHQQFTSIIRNQLENMPGFKWVKNDAIWFMYQAIAQCISIVSLITTIYFATIWLSRIL